jgi:hypothetical protein
MWYERIAILFGVLLVIAAIVACYRCIRDGKVGPEFGLSFSADGDEPKPPKNRCNCLFCGYVGCYIVLLAGAGLCFVKADVALPAGVLLMLAASVAMGFLQRSIERDCPDLASRMFRNVFF